MILIGLMSGTSADGIDAACVEIEEGDGRFNWRLMAFSCTPWTPELREAILGCCRHDAPLATVTCLNYRIGEEFAAAALRIAEAAGITIAEVNAIASHGQTVWHQPTPIVVAGASATGTMQIGEPAVIAARTGCVVVGDFRCADLALGGQGAPLVPYADLRLLASPYESRAIQNLGGIANVTLLPAGATPDQVVAFDTGPGNLLLDELTVQLTAGKQAYDVGGALAARGRACQSVLAECLDHPYFALPPPKSTGREMFGADYAHWFRKHATHAGCNHADILATATALTVESIVRAYRQWLLPRCPIGAVIAGGGGVHNRALMQLLEERVYPARLTTHAEFGVPDDAKEAIAFALLGYATLCGEPANVPVATGASGPAVLGKIALPPPGGRKIHIHLDKRPT